jgi:hypothetical protein
MLLSRIEPDSPAHDKRAFECRCGYELSEVVKYK